MQGGSESRQSQRVRETGGEWPVSVSVCQCVCCLAGGGGPQCVSLWVSALLCVLCVSVYQCVSVSVCVLPGRRTALTHRPHLHATHTGLSHNPLAKVSDTSPLTHRPLTQPSHTGLRHSPLTHSPLPTQPSHTGPTHSPLTHSPLTHSPHTQPSHSPRGPQCLRLCVTPMYNDVQHM